MSFVQSRSWSDHHHNWITGKVHWMERPWVTTCGRVVKDDWVGLSRWPNRTWTNLCKSCVPEEET